MITNPWAPWGLILSRRDGYPVLSEAAFWHLLGTHPEVVERAGPDETYVHLDAPYRLVRPDDRSYWILMPAPGRPKPAARPAATAA